MEISDGRFTRATSKGTISCTEILEARSLREALNLAPARLYLPPAMICNRSNWVLKTMASTRPVRSDKFMAAHDLPSLLRLRWMPDRVPQMATLGAALQAFQILGGVRGKVGDFGGVFI